MLAKPLAACIHLSSTVSQLFEPQVQSPFSRTAAHIFVSPGDALATITQYVASMERQFMLAKPLATWIGTSYTMLKSMRKSKNRYFYHVFVSHGDAPGTITLNVVWMERKFDA